MFLSLRVAIWFFLFTSIEASTAYAITKNNHGPKEITNGILGHVIGYQLLENAITHHQYINESSRYIHTEIVFMKLLGHDQALDHELPLDIIGIHPILERDVFIKLPNQSFTISIEQIPIIPTFALTIDKC